jgi:hypothetical protein
MAGHEVAAAQEAERRCCETWTTRERLESANVARRRP